MGRLNVILMVFYGLLMLVAGGITFYLAITSNSVMGYFFLITMLFLWRFGDEVQELRKHLNREQAKQDVEAMTDNAPLPGWNNGK